jgi:putative Holliday junction resolvase
MPTTPRNILSLDVGDKRVGVAIASFEALLPRPLTTLQRGDNFFGELRQLIETEDIGAIVIGLPRGLDGQSTSQTAATEKFAGQLRSEISLPVHLQDEALTSKQAESELQSHGGSHAKADIDALAATYILEDFLASYNKIGSTDNQ